jgi:two-component system nitrogen regulation response regulator GlnG
VDYLTKPFRLEDAAKSCAQALQGSVKSTETEAPDDTDATLLVGQSPQMQKVFRQIALVANSDLSVLITGETGTGKELVAAAIHRHSRRRDKDYIPVAPVTFSEAVLESELFGHVKGAFTGASDDRQGLFSLADRGTVLLDEIGDLPLTAQVKLLRVIEQGEFTAVGDVRPRKCNVRVIAATNRDLSHRVSEGTFREDLLYRLSAVSIHPPPLRERVEDIPLLCQHFLRRIGYGATEESISPELISQLQMRPWLGNVRELRNAIEHASVVARGRVFHLDDFPAPQARGGPPNGGTSGSLDQVIEDWAREELERGDGNAGDIDDLHERMLAATEPALLRIALEQTDGNRAAAAQLLGIHRGTLRERLKRYGSLQRGDGPDSSTG